MFKHASVARPWMIDSVEEIMKLPGVMVVEFGFCQYNMTSRDANEGGPVTKRTRILTTSLCLAKRFSKAQRPGHHRFPQANYKAGPCQEYTNAFCGETYSAVKGELVKKSTGSMCAIAIGMLNAMCRNSIGTATEIHPRDDSEEFRHLYHGMEFYDDAYGRPFNKERAVAARQIEMEFFWGMRVHSNVDRSAARQIGAPVITTKWIDTSKGDDNNLGHRARLVGRKITTDQRPDLFAATPPIESLRVISSMCASNRRGHGPYGILSSDVKRPHFFVKGTGIIYIEVPIGDRELGDENEIGRLNLSLYGRRDAAMNWQHEFTTTLVNEGFIRRNVSPCNFHHPGRDLHVTVHGDDFTTIGNKRQLTWFQTNI